MTEICLVEQVSGTTYMPTGQVDTATDGDGNVTTYSYDQVGNELSETDPAPNPLQPTIQPVTNYVYDALGRQTAIFSPLPQGEGQGEGGPGQGSAVTAYGYQFGQNGNTSNPGDTQTTSQGQAFTTSTNSVTFDNLPQSPNNSRTYVVYAQSSTAISSGSYTLSFSDNGTTPATLSPPSRPWATAGTRWAR